MAGPILVTPGQTVGSNDWDALVQQHGGMPSVGQKLPVDDPSVLKLLEQPGMGAYLQQHPVYRYYFADGTYADSYTDENGQDSHIVDYKPSARFTQQHPATGPLATGATVPTNTTEPNIVTRMPDGSIKTDPNPNYRKPPQTEGKPDPSKPDGYDNEHPVMVTRDANNNIVDQRELTAEERKAWEASRQASRNPGGVPDAQLPASKREPVKDHPGIYTVTSADPNNPNAISTHYENEAGQTVPTPPDAPTYSVRDVPINGKHYTVITKTPKDGTAPTTTNYGPDGQPVTSLPTEVKPGTIIKGGGAGGVDVQAVEDPDHPGQVKYVPIAGATPEAPGPDMPTIVAGQTQQALTQYHEALAKDPSLSPQQKKDHFAEFVQIANAGVTDATNAQREAESSRNAQTTIATNKLTFMQNGLDAALKFVLDFNDKLPQGSDAGAKAFAALMSINMLQLGMSGINDINTGKTIVPPVIPPGTPPPPTIANPANPADVNKAREEVAAHPANPASPAAQASAQSVQAPSTPTVPSAPAPPPPDMRNSSDMDLPPGTPPAATPAPAPATVPTPSAIPPADEFGRSAPSPTVVQPAAVPQIAADGNEQADDWLTVQAQDGSQSMVRRSEWDGTGTVVNAQNGASTTPTPMPWNEPTAPTPGVPLGQSSPPSDMGILAQYQQPPASQSVQPQQDFGPDPSDHPAVLHSLARTLPPWMIPEDQYQKMKAAGVPDDVIASVPSRQGVAA